MAKPTATFSSWIMSKDGIRQNVKGWQQLFSSWMLSKDGIRQNVKGWHPKFRSQLGSLYRLNPLALRLSVCKLLVPIISISS
jgi:hypothetical protein